MPSGFFSQLRTAEFASREAFVTSRSAQQIDRKAASASLALYRYMNSVSAIDRKAFDDLISEIAPSTSGGPALIGSSKTTSDLIQKSQVAAITVIDSGSNLGPSLVTLGELTAALSDPAAGNLVARANYSVGLISTAITRLVGLSEDRSGDVINDELSKLGASLKELQSLPVATNRLKKVAGVLMRDGEAFASVVATYRKLSADRKASLESLRTAFGVVTTELQSRLKTATASFEDAQTVADDAGSLMRNSVLISAPAVFLVGTLLALLIGRSITRPIVSLTRTMSRLADDDYEADVAGQERKDEVGSMSRAVQVFKENGLKRPGQLEVGGERTPARRASAKRGRMQAEAERASVAAAQASVVTDLAAGLAQLASGDLTGRVSVRFPRSTASWSATSTRRSRRCRRRSRCR